MGIKVAVLMDGEKIVDFGLPDGSNAYFMGNLDRAWHSLIALPAGMKVRFMYLDKSIEAIARATKAEQECEFQKGVAEEHLKEKMQLAERLQTVEQQRDALADENEMLRGRVHALESDKSGIRFICDKCNGFRELFDSALTPDVTVIDEVADMTAEDFNRVNCIRALTDERDALAKENERLRGFYGKVYEAMLYSETKRTIHLVSEALKEIDELFTPPAPPVRDGGEEKGGIYGCKSNE